MNIQRAGKIAISMILVFAGQAISKVHAQEQRPNIIYIMLDDAGYGDFGAFGSPYVKTPQVRS